jgi:hypothetical protein
LLLLFHKEKRLKIRNGFVSNSSSSSYCLYGVCWEIDTFKEFAGYIDNDDEDIYSFLDRKFGGMYSLQDDYIYVGYSPNAMKMDETKGNFLERVKNNLINLLPGLNHPITPELYYGEEYD